VDKQINQYIFYSLGFFQVFIYRRPFRQINTETMIRLTRVPKIFDGGRSYAANNLAFGVDMGGNFSPFKLIRLCQTTTLKMINRLIETTEGIIEVGGKDVMNQSPVDCAVK